MGFSNLVLGFVLGIKKEMFLFVHRFHWCEAYYEQPLQQEVVEEEMDDSIGQKNVLEYYFFGTFFVLFFILQPELYAFLGATLAATFFTVVTFFAPAGTGIGS